MVEMTYKSKIDWKSIIRVLLYVFLIGIVIGLFYYLVALPMIEILSKPFPGGYPFGVEGFFNMAILSLI